jgi:hypothetical protein
MEHIPHVQAVLEILPAYARDGIAIPLVELPGHALNHVADKEKVIFRYLLVGKADALHRSSAPSNLSVSGASSVQKAI